MEEEVGEGMSSHTCGLCVQQAELRYGTIIGWKCKSQHDIMVTIKVM